MSAGTKAAAPLSLAAPPALDDGTTSPATARPVDTRDVAEPPPITTRWAPTQRNGVPPVRRHPGAAGPGPAVDTGTLPGGATGGVDQDRGPARVLPLEDETTRRVLAQTRAVGQAILEVLAGARPAGQLVRWMDPVVHDGLVLRAELVRAAAVRADTARPGQAGPVASRPPYRQATVRSVHPCRISMRCYEMALVISEPGRCRAMALRLELRHLQWRVTALHLG